MSIGKSASTALLSLILAMFAGATQDKAAPPAAEEQANAEKVIKDIFKGEYARRGVQDRQSLAKKLLAQGIETKDDSKVQFVLFREARDLAAQANDPATAMTAIGELAKRFHIDAGGMRLSALALSAKTAKTAEDFKALTTASLTAMDSALASDDFDSAERFASPALQYAKKSQDLPLTTRVTAKSKEVVETKSQFEKVKKAKDALAANPEDGAANLLLGRFLCLTKGEWDKGLPLLAKGSDAALASLASKDLSGPGEAEAQVTIGDGWWDLAEKEPSPTKERLRERTGMWYAKAFERLTGLNKTKVEKRLVECRVAGALRGTWMDVTDPKLFEHTGKPGDPVELATSPGKITTLKMQFPKGEFDGLTARLTLDPGKDCTAFLVYEGPNGYALVVDTPRGFFANMKGGTGGWNLDFTDNWTKEAETVMTILVAGGEYVLYLNGKEKTRIKTNRTRIQYVALEARNSTVKFDQIKLRRAE